MNVLSCLIPNSGRNYLLPKERGINLLITGQISVNLFLNSIFHTSKYKIEYTRIPEMDFFKVIRLFCQFTASREFIEVFFIRKNVLRVRRTQ